MRPDVFAAVMATGIVSTAAAAHGLGVISVPLALLAVIALPVLMYLTIVRRQSLDLSDLDTLIRLFTYVAACTVLAARFAEHRWALWVLGALALQGWLTLVPVVARQMWRLGPVGLRDRARGAWELVSVATSGLAITFMTVGMVFWALSFWVVALCAYSAMTALIGWRAMVEPGVRRNVPPDHWVLMGALAIATLAGTYIYAGLHPGQVADAVRVVTLVTLGIATVQFVPLIVAGWRRMLDWPAVFPLGMYSTATYAMSTETGWAVLQTVSVVFCWVAVAAWLAVAVRTLRSRIGSRA